MTTEISLDNSLLDIVRELSLIDAGAKEITPEAMKQLGVVLREKTDRVVHFIKDCEARIQKHKDFEAEHKEARKHLEASLDRFKDYIVHTISTSGFEAIPGKEFVISTRKSEETVIFREPTAMDAEQWPELVRTKTTYEWNKQTLKDWQKRGENVLDVSGIRINYNVKIGVKK